MTRQISILLIMMLGFFLTPTLTYACGKKTEKTEKSCCEKSTSQTGNSKDCCKKSHSQDDKNDDDCNGQCGNSSCHCPTINITIALPIFPELKHSVFYAKKLNFFYTETYISSGFRSIWQPPKIS
ncbi:MAG: hypothetical protein M9892_12090 [Bacteroidetes bacterium]|nr:hypothetical protein [Bacteroidota bacterium]